MFSLTRAALHDRVWSKPLSDVSTDLRLPLATLVSVCRQNDIPLPPPHYWRMVANGSPATRRALPTERLRRNHLVYLDSDAHWIEETQANPTATEAAASATLAAASAAPVEVTDPAAIKIRKDLQRAKKAGAVKTRLGFVEVNIGDDSIDRVANMLAGVQSRFNERLWPAADGDGGSIMVGEERVELLLSEGTERVPHIPTFREIRDHQRYGGWIPEHDVVRSGRLQLSITNAAYLGVRQKWADGKRQRIEAILDAFVEGIQTAANAIRERRLEREEQHRKWEEEEKRRKERERLETIERVRGAVLRQQAATYDEAQRLRAYIEAVRSRLQDGVANDVGVREWILWAEEHVTRLDPLSRGLPLLLSEDEAIRLKWTYPKQ